MRSIAIIQDGLTKSLEDISFLEINEAKFICITKEKIIDGFEAFIWALGEVIDMKQKEIKEVIDTKEKEGIDIKGINLRQKILKSYRYMKQDIELILSVCTCILQEESQVISLLGERLKKLDGFFTELKDFSENLIGKEELEKPVQVEEKLYSWEEFFKKAKIQHSKILILINNTIELREIRDDFLDQKKELETELSEAQAFVSKLSDQLAAKFKQSQQNSSSTKLANNDLNSPEQDNSKSDEFSSSSSSSASNSSSGSPTP